MPAAYHAATFQLLGGEPPPDADALAALAEAERAGGPLPAAVRDWYARAGAVEALRQDRSEGDAVPLDELLETFRQLAGLGPDARRHARVLIGSPTQNAYQEWAVALDGTDDPPVLRGTEDAFGTELSWRREPFAGSFSAFVFYWVWTHRTYGASRRPDAAWLRAEGDPPLTPPDLDFLVGSFHEGPRVEWGGGTTEYCFFDPAGRVRIDTDPLDRPGGFAQWELYADTPEALDALARKVWRCGTLADTLGATTDAGRAVLARLRG